jgi:hypothetical protein
MYPFLPYEKGVKPGTEFVTFDIPDVGRFGRFPSAMTPVIEVNTEDPLRWPH